MAKISIKGNIGKVQTGHQQEQKRSYISFSVAENHGYRNKQSGEWIDKGALWHKCTLWIHDNNERFEHYSSLLTVGTPVIVIGQLNINPSQKTNDQTGEVTDYQNPYINVDDIGITLNRIESLTYKPKQDIGGASDPAYQQKPQEMSQQPQFEEMPDGIVGGVNMSDDSPF